MKRPSNPFSMLVELYGEGGIAVSTKRGGADADDEAERIVARSVVQPDADVIHMLTPAVLRSPALLEEHLAAVRSRVSAARLLRRALDALRLGSLLPAAFAGYQLAAAGCERAGCGGVELPGGDPLPLVAGLAGSALLFGAGRLARALLRWRIRARLTSTDGDFALG